MKFTTLTFTATIAVLATTAVAHKGASAILQIHSGDAMLALFPEGMNAAPSVAKDAI